jgi:hypothetical protein
MGRGTVAWTLAGAVVALAALAPPAVASFHLIKVREVYPGGAGDSYVELQMYAASQNFLGGHAMTVYDDAGALVHKSTFSTSVANGANQSTVLIGGSGVQASFGLTPDLVDPELSLPGAGGAVCWNAGGIPADCVAWGSFSGGTALQAATGTTVGSPVSPAGITAGKAIRRTVQPGCPTLLEESDDSDSSLADFSEVTPGPRDNGSPIVEEACPGVPNTAIDERPDQLTNLPTAHFTYEAPTATGFECRLDEAPFSSCPASGVEYAGLADGGHSFAVRGFNVSGPDPTPASYAWTVDTEPPTTTIDQAPADPSPGASAGFAFHASEATSGFQCSLVPVGEAAAFSPCSSGVTYADLADGSYAFEVRATDLAGNQESPPAEYVWTVDNTVPDTTPPETSLLSFPPDPSTSDTASFTYASNEAGSTFECAIDSAAFAPCAATGITYVDLADGPHSFQVRAIDPSANVDPTPAGYSFDVVLAPPALGPPPVEGEPAPLTPRTFLSGHPRSRTRDRTPTFRFRSDRPGARFRCSIDRHRPRPCRSPFTSRRLALGRHLFSVQAVLAGVADRTPARFRFRIVGRRSR